MEPLLGAIDAKLWGDLSPPSWITRKFSFATDPAERSWTLYYELLCSRYERVHPNSFQAVLRVDDSSPTRLDSVSVEGRSIALEAPIYNREVTEVLPWDPTGLLDIITTRLLRQAHRVYVIDPRSGTRFARNATPIPRSPLFDPQLLVHEQDDLTRGAGPLCCFCSTREPGFVWGNGALMWVHQQCWGAVFGVIEEVK